MLNCHNQCIVRPRMYCLSQDVLTSTPSLVINRINATANLLTSVLVKENEIEVDRLHIQTRKMMITPFFFIRPVFGNALECETGSLFVCILPVKSLNLR